MDSSGRVSSTCGHWRLEAGTIRPTSGNEYGWDTFYFTRYASLSEARGRRSKSAGAPTMTKAQRAERDDARTALRALLPPGCTVYTILRHVARSGMFRTIEVLRFHEGPPRQPHSLTWLAAIATGFPYNRRHEALGISGCGMDMGFHVVSNLSRVLYPAGFGCIGDGCPSNDHSNGDRDYTPHMIEYTAETCPGRPCGSGCDHKSGPGRPHWHSAGDYALRHRWL